MQGQQHMERMECQNGSSLPVDTHCVNTVEEHTVEELEVQQESPWRYWRYLEVLKVLKVLEMLKGLQRPEALPLALEGVRRPFVTLDWAVTGHAGEARGAVGSRRLRPVAGEPPHPRAGISSDEAVRRRPGAAGEPGDRPHPDAHFSMTSMPPRFHEESGGFAPADPPFARPRGAPRSPLRARGSLAWLARRTFSCHGVSASS